MDFGVQVGCYRNTWDEIRAVVELLDTGGWNSVWFADHFLPPPGRPEEEPLTAHEAFTVAAAVAAFTNNLQIGHLVLGNTYRNPGLVAKMAANIDQISHGRFTLGIGAAWFKREHEAYGWNFPSMKERQDRFEEAMELLRNILHANGPTNFSGQYYGLNSAPLSPGSFNKTIPVLVGGTGERRTLRTLAKYGDVMNLDGWAGGPMTKEYFQHKVKVVEQHCELVGRDPSDIRYTVLMPIMISEDTAAVEAFIEGRRLGVGSAAGEESFVVDRIGELVEAGADEIMFGGLLTNEIDKYQYLTENIITKF